MVDWDLELDKLLHWVVEEVRNRTFAVNLQIALVYHLLVAVEDYNVIICEYELQLAVFIDLAHRIWNTLQM